MLYMDLVFDRAANLRRLQFTPVASVTDDFFRCDKKKRFAHPNLLSGVHTSRSHLRKANLILDIYFFFFVRSLSTIPDGFPLRLRRLSTAVFTMIFEFAPYPIIIVVLQIKRYTNPSWNVMRIRGIMTPRARGVATPGHRQTQDRYRTRFTRQWQIV